MRTRGILAAAALAAIPALAHAAETCTDVALVLLADVSYSMKDDERRIQREGYAQAFRHPEVVQAITGGYCGRIDVTYVEYADKAHIVVDWRTVDSPASAIALSQANVRGGPGSFVMQALGIHELGLIVRRKLAQEIG